MLDWTGQNRTKKDVKLWNPAKFCSIQFNSPQLSSVQLNLVIQFYATKQYPPLKTMLDLPGSSDYTRGETGKKFSVQYGIGHDRTCVHDVNWQDLRTWCILTVNVQYKIGQSNVPLECPISCWNFLERAPVYITEWQTVNPVTLNKDSKLSTTLHGLHNPRIEWWYMNTVLAHRGF